MSITALTQSNAKPWYKFQADTSTSSLNADVWLALFMGLSVLSYLLPWHASVGKDFLVNALAFVCVTIGIAGYLILGHIKSITLTSFTWLLLALLLVLQPLFLTINYPDSLIFPLASLIVAAFLGVLSSNIEDKAKFLKLFFYTAYIMAVCTFIIQLMQIMDTNIMLGYLEITLKSENGRLYANFMQPNHTAYAYVLALCGVIYQLHLFNQPSVDKKAKSIGNTLGNIGLLWLLIVFIIGIALTQSRAGLVMLLCIPLVYFISQPLSIQNKIKLITISIVGLLVVYTATSWFYSQFLVAYANESLGGISRLATVGAGNRINLSQRALMMFQDHPIMGVGWNNYMEASLTYAADFDWPEIANHSHNVITMILAELGILGLLCLLPLLWMLVKSVHFKHSPQSAVALTFVVVTIVYMMVEFPLWYFRYLAVFALFLGLIEQKYLPVPKFLSTTSAKYSMAGVMIILSVIAEFYVWQFSNRHYLDYQKFYYLDLGASGDNKLAPGDEVFGFTNYHNMIIATQTPIDGNDNAYKKDLFKKAIGSSSSQYYLQAYAKILAYGNEKDQALSYFETACIMGKTRAGGCEDVTKELKDLAVKEPAVFSGIYTAYEAWQLNNPDQTGESDSLKDGDS